MQDLIKKIISMDIEAQKIRDNAELEKIKSKEEILETKESIHQKYLDKALIRASKNDLAEQDLANEQWEETMQKHNWLQKELESKFEQNKDKFVSTIVANVLNEF